MNTHLTWTSFLLFFSMILPAQTVVINECDADQGTLDQSEFIELYDGGAGFTSLNDLVVLISDGPDYLINSSFDLIGLATNAQGYFLLGGSGIGEASYALPDDSLPDHATIIILYQKPLGVTALADLDPLKILDAIVYGIDDADDTELLSYLETGQPQLNENQFSQQAVHALQRLPNGAGPVLHTDTMVAALPTPGVPNHSVILINEVDAATTLDDKEFIELYDGGLGLQPLDGLVILFYDGFSDNTYGPALDLAGRSTDDNGFFLIGNSDVSGVDLVIDSGLIQNGADGIGLYAGTGTDFTLRSIQTDRLVDGLVYHTHDTLPPGSTLMDLILPGQEMIDEEQFEGRYIHSMQRFPDHSGGNMVTSTYVLSKPTPKASNHATPLINEVDSDQGIIDDREFIEIYDQGRGFTSLNGYILVLYDGESDSSYHTFDLNGFQTDENGFFLLGTAQVSGRDLTFSDDFLKDGAHAIALFQADPQAFPDGSPVLTHALEDAVVYSLADHYDAGLQPLLLAGQDHVFEDALAQKDEHSLQRFSDGRGGPRVTDFISPALPTPKMPNTIRANKIVINEMDVDNGASDSLEFIEIYDGGDGLTSLNGLLIVLYNGTGDLSYQTLDLNGFTTDEDGYFLLATAAVASEYNVQIDIILDDDTFQDGQDAAVLYLGRAEDFPDGTQIQLDYIEDALVYDTGESDDPELLTLLNSGEPQVDESSRGNSAVHSMQRFPNGSGGNQNTSTFAVALPTPDGPNMEGMIINEVDSDTPGTDDREFIELYDGGRGGASLDGMVLVFYDGQDDSPYLVLDLDGYSTDAQGYFVVGNGGVIPSVNLIIPDDSIEDGADAVALYNADDTDFATRAVTLDGLLDAVVYDTGDASDSGLLSLLNQGEEQLDEDGLNNKDGHSLQRSPNGLGGPRNTSTFIQAVATPSAPNITWSYSTRFTDLNDPGNPGGINIEEDINIEDWVEITTAEHMTNTWSSERDIGFDFTFFGKPVTEFKVSQNGLLTFSVNDLLLPSDSTDNIDLTTQNPFNPIIPDFTICAFWDSFTNAPPTNSNDKVYMKIFGDEPARQLWIKWASFEYGNPNSSFNYFAIVLEEGSNIVYVVDYNWHSAVPVSSTVALYSNAHHFVQVEPVSTAPDEIAFLDGNTRSADKEDNDFYEFFPTSNLVDMELNMVRVDPNPLTPINVGDRVTYLISASNMGINGVTDVMVNVDLSEKLTYYDHTSAGRPFDPGSGNWEVGFVPPGHTVVLAVIADVNDSHQMINRAELITMSGFDIDSVANNHILAEDDQVELIEVIPDAADLVVSLSVDNHIADIGSEVLFTIDIMNDGPDTGHLICVEAMLPLGLEYVSDNGAGSYLTGIWDVGMLSQGGSASLEIRAEVVGHNGTPDYSITNTVTICTTAEHDPVLMNNQDSVTIFYRLAIWFTTPVGGEEAVNTYYTGIQAFPSVGMASTGDYYISWQSESSQDGDLSGVYMRKYTFPTTAQTGEILVNYFTQNHQRYAQVDTTPLGNGVFIWQDEGQNGLWEGIYGMQISPAGQPVLPGQYQVHHFTNAVHSRPDIAIDALGNQIAVWESHGQDGDGLGIYGRLLDSSNLPITSEFEISTTTVWDQKRPRVSCDDAGNFVVTWQSWDQDEDGWAIVGRRFAADATPLGLEFIVNTAFAGDQKNPDLAMSPDGEVTIVWQGPLADSEFGIFGQVYDSSGVPEGQVFQVNSYSQMLVASPRIAMDSVGNFVVVWYSLGQDGDGAGVFAQQFRAGGMPEGYEFLVNTTTAEDQSFPDVACNAEGQFIVTWQSYQQDTDDEGIFARAFEPPCQPLRDPSAWPVPISVLDFLLCVP